MQIHLVAVGQKKPAWVVQACDDYLKRLPRELRINLIEVPLIKRGRNPDVQRIVRDESRKLLQAVPAGCRMVALDVNGQATTTASLAASLQSWMQEGRAIAFVVGGPEGLSGELLQQADRPLSLSAMTFPHALVRIIMLEQLYRAWSILSNHPYHRA